MSRKLKFRAYNPEAAEWNKKYAVEEGKYLQEWYSQDDLRDYCLDIFDDDCDMEIMQFTGLKDDNGTEIYEGDIVQYDTEDGIIIAKIEWQISESEDRVLSGFSFEPILFKDYEDDEAVGFIVIGNIYSNPELLGGER